MGKILFTSFEGSVIRSRRGFPPNGTQRAYVPGSGEPSIPWGSKIWWQPNARDGLGQPYDGSEFGGGAAQAAVVQNANFSTTIGGNTAAQMINSGGSSALVCSAPATGSQFFYPNGLTWGVALEILSIPTAFQAVIGTSIFASLNGWGVIEPTGSSGQLRYFIGNGTTGGAIDWTATLGVHVLMGTYDPTTGDMELFVDGISVGTANYPYNAGEDTGNAFIVGGMGGQPALPGNYGPASQYGTVISPQKFEKFRNYLLDYAGLPIP